MSKDKKIEVKMDDVLLTAMKRVSAEHHFKWPTWLREVIAAKIEAFDGKPLNPINQTGEKQ